MRHGLFCALALATACGSPVGSPSAPETEPSSGAETTDGTYRIVLSRPSRAGESYREHTVHTNSRARVITVRGAVVEETTEERTLELIARVHVREASERGDPVVLEYQVERCVLREAGAEREVVPAGALIRVTRVPRGEGEGSIQRIGGALSEEDAEILDMMVSTTISEVRDDQIFGTDQARRVGESWPIDAELAARDLDKMPELTISEDQVSGQTTLEALEDVGGVPCLRLRAEVRAEGFVMAGLPEGSTTEHAQMTARMRGWLPTDAAVSPLREEETLDMSLRMRLPRADGEEAVLDMRFSDVETSQYAR